MSDDTIESSCHCGAIRIQVPTAPETVTDCNCSICRRYGVLWAYYTPSQVRIVAATDAATDTYQWGHRKIAFHRCKACGCVTHWAAIDRDLDRMGINARLMDMRVLAAARVRKLDGAVTWRYDDEPR